MAGFNFPIRTRLALWAGLGVLLVAGMLAEQQYGDHLAGLQRAAADQKQRAAVEALHAADDLRCMQIAMREVRLAISPGEVDRAMKLLDNSKTAAAKHIGMAIAAADAPADKEQLGQLARLAEAYDRTVTELATAAKEYGDTVEKVKQAIELGGKINATGRRHDADAGRGRRRAQGESERRSGDGEPDQSRHGFVRDRRTRRCRGVRRGRDQPSDPPRRGSAAGARPRQPRRRSSLYRTP